MEKLPKTIFVTGAIALVVGLAAAQLMRNQEAVQAKVYRKKPDSRVLVKVDTVQRQNLPFANAYLGEFLPNREITITAETQGKIIRMAVEEGQYVQAGALLAQIDSDLLQAQLIGSQSKYDNAVTTLQRYENAALGEGVSGTQLDNARLEVKNTESQLKQLQKQLAQTRIMAPFSGYVTARSVDYGSFVAPGTQIATLTDISSLKLEVNVPEKEVMNFRVGQSVTLTSDVYPGKTYAGKVWMVAAKAEVSHQYTVKIDLKNPKEAPLKAGMYGSLVLEQESADEILAIPRLALLGSAKEPKVYVVQQGVATAKTITIGRSNDQQIEVINGLYPGDVVVVSGQVNLGEKTPIAIAP